jgi:hypothetical protein
LGDEESSTLLSKYHMMDGVGVYSNAKKPRVTPNEIYKMNGMAINVG